MERIISQSRVRLAGMRLMDNEGLGPGVVFCHGSVWSLEV
jgi:hypothetical protein